MPIKVVGIRFKTAGKIYYFDPGDMELEIGDCAIVETTRGVEYGMVVVGPKEVAEDEVVAPLKKVIRKATEEDELQLKKNNEKEKRAYQIGLEKIAAHGLPMKLIDVEQTFDGNKIIFYFTADGRVDFRELVKDLAAVFRTRIELRQIGVRDEAKMLGGLGCCGRELCCKSWLAEFNPVSIRMAKDQNLSLNPTKISGICGRLMCCLKYENDVYEEAKERFPNTGTNVITPSGEGKVTGYNIFKNTVSVELRENKHVIELPKNEIEIKNIKGENSGPSSRKNS
ncbi:cell fate regulator YaaT (PSP1 superfamily) [Desulfohalotomaculum tongense]|uniref:PSP1 domain-containing protein n=1 Tax=Desulforadius tongensis TaxID=1216062 RepID=UPI00195CBD4A|nr:stage 0 sporulation family protein [Desulforadius tongensis]MBM7855171.1 cell fate regulator YaaT (PSP1 superfamily) [Desulforadius tongensis]